MAENKNKINTKFFFSFLFNITSSCPYVSHRPRTWQNVSIRQLNGEPGQRILVNVTGPKDDWTGPLTLEGRYRPGMGRTSNMNNSGEGVGIISFAE